MNKKVIKFAIVICAILMIALLSMIFSKTNVAKNNIEKINDLEKDYSDYVMPLNRTLLTDKYEGKLSRETLYTLLYEFSLDTLPELRKKAVNDPDKFYEKNKEYIYIKTGIEDATTFKALVSKIKALPEDLTLSQTEIKEDSVKRETGYTEATLVVYYNNDDAKVEINIKVGNKENNERTSIIFN